MNLYLDDDIAGHVLMDRLRKDGHAVTSPAEAGRAGETDALHFEYAILHGLVLLSRNHDDFKELHRVVVASGGRHPGVLMVRLDNDPTRDMSDRGIVTAIRNLESSGVPIENQVSILNQWR